MSVFGIVILVCEYAVSSLVTEQDRAREQLYRTCPYKAPCYSFSIGILLFYYDYFLTLTVIRDEVRPFSVQYGTAAFVSKYGFCVSRDGYTALCTAVHRLAPALVAAFLNGS